MFSYWMQLSLKHAFENPDIRLIFQESESREGKRINKDILFSSKEL